MTSALVLPQAQRYPRSTYVVAAVNTLLGCVVTAMWAMSTSASQDEMLLRWATVGFFSASTVLWTRCYFRRAEGS